MSENIVYEVKKIVVIFVNNFYKNSLLVNIENSGSDFNIFKLHRLLGCIIQVVKLINKNVINCLIIFPLITIWIIVA